MHKIWTWVKHEYLVILPAWFFFFVVSICYDVTRLLTLREYGIPFVGFARAFVVAAIIAKILAVMDHLSLINRFDGRPLIYNTLWKTMVYYLCSLVLQYLEPVGELVIKHWSFAAANRHWCENFLWPRFLNAQIWIIIALLIFCSFREMARAVGPDKLRRLFFGPA